MAAHPWKYSASNMDDFEGYPVLANAVIEVGDLIGITAAGFATRLAGATHTKFGGIAHENVTGTGTSGERRVRCITRGVIYTKTQVGNYTQANVNDAVYAVDHNGGFTNTALDNLQIGKFDGIDVNLDYRIQFQASTRRDV